MWWILRFGQIVEDFEQRVCAKSGIFIYVYQNKLLNTVESVDVIIGKDQFGLNFLKQRHPKKCW